VARIATLGLAFFAGSRLVPGAQDPAAGPIHTKIAAKENGTKVSVRGDRFVVRLPRQGGTRYQWKPLKKDSGAAAAPRELEDLRKFVRSADARPGSAELQESTFEMPASREPVKLVLVYTYRRDPSQGPQDGPLYKSEGEKNQPEPDMRFVVTLMRE
jgi:hypothetical protein